MAYIITLPSLQFELVKEVMSAYKKASSPDSFASELCQCPRLVAVYHETMRLVTSSVSVRDVAESTMVGGVVLRKGNRVLIPYRQMLFERGIFGDRPDEFHPERFLEDKALTKSPYFRPFGGGRTYCPGRYLAKAEVLSCVGLMLTRFDITAAGHQVVSFPRLEEKRPCLGIMSPVAGGDLIIEARERGLCE